jgi:iron complex outermembrane receptor protein
MNLRPVVAALFWFLLSSCVIAAPEPLRVRVVDSMNAAVAGARVTAGGRPAEVTGPDGAVRVEAAGARTLRVERDGFEPAEVRLSDAPPDEIVVRLRPAIVRNSVDVVVRDEPVSGPVVSTAVEIERGGARTVLDAVDQLVPGAFVTRRGVMGYGISTNGTGGVSIRGVGGSPNTGVLVVVDGRPDMQGLMGHPLPDFYSLSDAGTVSVTQGPASVLYGSNAMGGAIEVKPTSPHPGVSTRWSSSLGSYLTGQHRLAQSMRWEKFYYSGTAGVSHTAGDRPSSAFRDQDTSLTTGYTLSSVWRTSVEGRYGHFHVEDPGPVTAPLSGSYARVGRGGFSANLDNSTSRSWGYMRFYQSNGNHYITDGFRSTDSTTGFRLSQNFALTRELAAEVGSDVVSYGGRARNVTGKLDYGEHSIFSAAGFSRVQWTPSTRARLYAGLRYDDNSVAGAITVPEAGASYTLKDGYTASASISRGFRNPTIRELYLFPAPNPLLRPEYMWNYQASFHARPAKNVAASVTTYYADLSNMIVAQGRYPNLRLLNAGRALNRGAEGSLRWRPWKRMSLQSGYAYLRSTNLAPYLPEQKLNYSAEFDAGKAFVHLGGTTVGRRWADAAHSRKMSGYTVATCRIMVPVRKSWSVFTTLDNLFDRRYEVVPGYIMPGVNAAGGVTVSF